MRRCGSVGFNAGCTELAKSTLHQHQPDYFLPGDTCPQPGPSQHAASRNIKSILIVAFSVDLADMNRLPIFHLAGDATYP
jgi:hypothetical protein